jgi:hypothetical protein
MLPRRRILWTGAQLSEGRSSEEIMIENCRNYQCNEIPMEMCRSLTGEQFTTVCFPS